MANDTGEEQSYTSCRLRIKDHTWGAQYPNTFLVDVRLVRFQSPLFPNKRKASGTQMTDEVKRLYPECPALTKAGRNLAWEHTPSGKDGWEMRWDLSAKMTCSRCVKCNYRHELMKSAGLHWDVYDEILRRGRHRRNRRAVDVADIEGRIRKLRDTNDKEKGGEYRTGHAYRGERR